MVLDVSAAGVVTLITLEQSSGDGDLDRSAIGAARTWQFNPATNRSGTAVPGRVRVPIQFSIDAADTQRCGTGAAGMPVRRMDPPRYPFPPCAGARKAPLSCWCTQIGRAR